MGRIGASSGIQNQHNHPFPIALSSPGSLDIAQFCCGQAPAVKQHVPCARQIQWNARINTVRSVRHGKNQNHDSTMRCVCNQACLLQRSLEHGSTGDNLFVHGRSSLPIPHQWLLSLGQHRSPPIRDVTSMFSGRLGWSTRQKPTKSRQGTGVHSGGMQPESCLDKNRQVTNPSTTAVQSFPNPQPASDH